MTGFFDLHCDTATACCQQGKSLLQNEFQLDLMRGSQMKKWVQVFACFLDDSFRGEKAFDEFLAIRNFIFATVQNNKEKIAFYNKNDIKENCCNALISVEGGCVLGGELEKIKRLKELNVSILTLTWNGDNEIGSGVGGTDNGLTEFGKKAVCELEKNGIIIDISHLNDKGVNDVFSLATKPIIASHSNARAVCPQRRNLTDEQIKYLIDNNGLCGINFFPLFINGEDDYTLDDMRRHLEHILNLGGENILALGSDFDGAPMPTFIKDIKGVYSLYENVVEWFGEKTADKLFFDNANRFIRLSI